MTEMLNKLELCQLFAQHILENRPYEGRRAIPPATIAVYIGGERTARATAYFAGSVRISPLFYKNHQARELLLEVGSCVHKIIGKYRQRWKTCNRLAEEDFTLWLIKHLRATVKGFPAFKVA